MAFQDKQLTCRDCGKEFTWTAAEQEFYAQKGFDNPPVRCKDCRQAKKARMNDRDGGQRQSFKITCANCGREDTVPFKPRDESSVLCRDCFQKDKMGQSA